jgi:hypothetical protein
MSLSSDFPRRQCWISEPKRVRASCSDMLRRCECAADRLLDRLSLLGLAQVLVRPICWVRRWSFQKSFQNVCFSATPAARLQVPKLQATTRFQNRRLRCASCCRRPSPHRFLIRDMCVAHTNDQLRSNQRLASRSPQRECGTCHPSRCGDTRYRPVCHVA